MPSEAVTIDAARLAEQVAARCGIGMLPEPRQVNGAAVICVRPSDLVSPNGFVIQVVPSWRSIEAAFVPDRFAGDLVRSMGQSSAGARVAFERSANAFVGSGLRISLRINESVVSNFADLPVPPWNRFELKMYAITDATVSGEHVLLASACGVASSCLALVLALLPLEEDVAEPAPMFEGGLPDGARTRVEVNRYERNPVNRAACISRYGAVCNACGFDFGKAYGSVAEGYVEVHHVIPVSKMGGSYVVDPVTDLIPLCANCHRAVHQQDPPLTMEALRKALQKGKERGSS